MCEKSWIAPGAQFACMCAVAQSERWPEGEGGIPCGMNMYICIGAFTEKARESLGRFTCEMHNLHARTSLRLHAEWGEHEGAEELHMR